MRPMDLQNKENKQRIKKRIRGRLLRLASFLMILSGIFTILASILLLMLSGMILYTASTMRSDCLIMIGVKIMVRIDAATITG